MEEMAIFSNMNSLSLAASLMLVAVPAAFAAAAKSAAKAENPVILIKTSEGDITLELFAESAPGMVLPLERPLQAPPL